MSERSERLTSPIYYPYVNAEGEPVHRQVRYPGKRFFQERWDPVAEGWRRGLKDVCTVPYRLPEVLAGIKAGRTIFVVEGEKDADNVSATGRIATCNPGGTGMGWQPHLSQYFKGAVVVIIQDGDSAGHSHALKVKEALQPVAEYVTILESRVGKDISDALEAGKGFALRPARRYAHVNKPKPPLKSDPQPGGYPLDGGRGVAVVLSRLQGVTKTGQAQWQAYCPAHEENRTKSLSVGIGDFRPVKMYCQAGCTFNEVMAALNLPFSVVM